jgi:hypothetical protein
MSIRVNVPRSPLSRIGVPPKSVGLAADADVEAQLAFERTLAGAATMTATLTLARAVFAGVPVDAELQLQAAGTAAAGLDVKHGSLRAGPLRANVTGTLKLFDDGARLALAWAAPPVSCEELGKKFAAQALGAQLGALAAQISGSMGLKMTGEAVASGLITLDSRDVSGGSATMTSNETCGIALF